MGGFIREMYHRMKLHGRHFLYFLKWLAMAILVGLVTGLVGAAFSHGLTWVTGLRGADPGLVFGLPIGGLFIVWLYHISGRRDDKGTNMILEAVREEVFASILQGPIPTFTVKPSSRKIRSLIS